MSSEHLKSIIDRLASVGAGEERQRLVDELRAAPAESVPALVGALEHDNRFVRMKAAGILGELRADEAVPALIQAMSDEFVRVRRAALGALIKIGQPAVEQVKAACRSENPRIQRFALTVLRRLEVKDAVEEALQAFQSDPSAVRREAARSLPDTRDWPAAQAHHSGVRREAAKLLLASDDEKAFETAVNGLSDEVVADVVAHELLTLGERGRQILLDAAQGQDRTARRAAAVALAKDGRPETLGTLMESYAEDEIPVGWEAPEFIEAAVAAGRQVPFERLLEQASGAIFDPNEPHVYDGQCPALEALGKIGDPRAVPVLKDLVNSPHPVIGRLAVQALGQIGTPECVALLVESMGHPIVSVRGQAAVALVGLREAALEPVLHALGSDNRPRRENAAHVLSEWGKLALPGILQAAASQNPVERWMAFLAINIVKGKHPEALTNEARRVVAAGLDDEDACVRRLAASVESEIRDQKSIPALVAHLTDGDRRVRHNCAQALARIGETALEAILKSLRAADAVWTLENLGRALGAMGEAAVEHATDLVGDPNPLVRRAAGVALAASGSPSALPALVTLAHDDDGLVVSAGMWALPHFATEEAAQALDYIVGNEKLDKDLRRIARRLREGMRKGQRLEREAPGEDEEG